MNDDKQFTFDTDGSIDKPEHYSGKLEEFGVSAEECPRETKIDRPEPDVFGEPPAGDRDVDPGEQAGLCRETDEQQQQLNGDVGAETPADWEE